MFFNKFKVFLNKFIVQLVRNVIFCLEHDFYVNYIFLELFTSTIITIWRQQVTVAFCWVVREAWATIRHITQLTTLMRPLLPTKIGRRRHPRNPSWMLPRRPHIPMVRTHPFPVSIGPESQKIKTAKKHKNKIVTAIVETKGVWVFKNFKRVSDKPETGSGPQQLLQEYWKVFLGFISQYKIWQRKILNLYQKFQNFAW